MDLNKTLSEILNKTYFYDFTFSYEFIENLKFECRSLYDILVVFINKRLKIIPDKIKEIQPTSNYVINYYIKYCSIYNVFFNHNQHITELQALYDELNNVEDDIYNNIKNLKYLIQNITNYNNNINYEYNILIHTIKSDIQKRDKIENAGLDYHLYLEELLNTKSESISTNIISDYFSFIYNNKNYELVVKMYKKYNIEEKLIIVNHPLVRTNIFVMILLSLFQTNRLISTYQCKILLDKYDIDKIEDNTGIIKINLEMIQKIYKHIEQREYYIKSIGYDIVNETIDSRESETCLVCMEDIEEEEICFIKCNNCHKKLGHINCVSRWLVSRKDCPNCRYNKILQ